MQAFLESSFLLFVVIMYHLILNCKLLLLLFHNFKGNSLLYCELWHLFSPNS